MSSSSRSSRSSNRPPRRSSTLRRWRERAFWVFLSLAGGMGTLVGSRWLLDALAVPSAIAFGALAFLTTLGALIFIWMRPEAGWNALGIAVGLGALTGVTAHALVAPSGHVERVDPNRQVAARVLLLGKALERYAYQTDRADNHSKYPRNADFIRWAQGLKLAEDPLLSPWGAVRQPNLVAAGAVLPPATVYLGGATPPPLQTRLGEGLLPGAGPFTARTYGALVYDLDPKTDTFVLYGVGRLGEQAVLVAVVRSKP